MIRDVWYDARGYTIIEIRIATIYIAMMITCVSVSLRAAVCCCYNEDQGPQDHCPGLQQWEDGVHRSQKVRTVGVIAPRGLLYSDAIVFADDMCRSEELSRLAARKYARIIQKLGFPVSLFVSHAVARRLASFGFGMDWFLRPLYHFAVCRQGLWSSRFRIWLGVVMSSSPSGWRAWWSNTTNFQGITR